MKLHLGGHLAWYVQDRQTLLHVELLAPESLRELVERLHVPVAEIAVAAVNGESSSLDTIVANSDRVDLFPPVGGGVTIAH